VTRCHVFESNFLVKQKSMPRQIGGVFFSGCFFEYENNLYLEGRFLFGDKIFHG